MLRAAIATLLLLAAGASAEAGTSSLGNPALDNPAIGVPSFQRGHVPLCNQPNVMGNIASRYHWVTTRTFGTNLAISTVEHIDEVRHVPAAAGLIDRRFCHALVQLSNGTASDLFYLIEERQGIASIGWGVEFCLPNQDPWRAFDGNCRSIRAPVE